MNVEHFYFEAEGLSKHQLTHWDEADRQLSFLDPQKLSFIVLSLPDESYIQCAGSKRQLTVEARIYSSANDYAHYRFGKGLLSKEEVVIRCNVGPIFIDKSQVLTIEDAETIMRYFIETGGLHPDYTATHLTEDFENP